MSELNTLVPKTDRRPPSFWRPPVPEEPQQRRMMVAALTLLLIALGFVLYHDRDFWFPDTQEAQEAEDKQPASPAAASPSESQATVHRAPRIRSLPRVKTPLESFHRRGCRTIHPHPSALRPPEPCCHLSKSRSSLETSIARLHPGTNSVRSHLQPGIAPEQDPASRRGCTTQPTPLPPSPTMRPSVCRCLSIPPRSSASP